jgi:hypothetical protein
MFSITSLFQNPSDAVAMIGKPHGTRDIGRLPGGMPAAVDLDRQFRVGQAKSTTRCPT